MDKHTIIKQTNTQKRKHTNTQKENRQTHIKKTDIHTIRKHTNTNKETD